MHLVPRRHLAEHGRHQRLGQPQSVHRPAIQLAFQSEQFAGGIVAQHHPVRAVEQDQPLAHRVQGRLVVLVQVAEFVRPHAVGVPPQPGVGEVGAQPAEGQGTRRDADQGEQRSAQLGGDRLQRQAHADQRDHPVPVVPDRGDHPHGRAERAGVRLTAGLPGQRPVDVPEVLLADLLGQRVGPAHPVGVHDGDEGDPRVLAHLLDVRLEHRGRVGPADGGAHGGRVGDGMGDRGDLAAGRVLGALGGEQVREHRAARDHGGDDDHLDDEQLPGQAADQPVRQGEPPVTRAGGGGAHGHACQCAPRPGPPPRGRSAPTGGGTAPTEPRPFPSRRELYERKRDLRHARSP